MLYGASGLKVGGSGMVRKLDLELSTSRSTLLVLGVRFEDERLSASIA